jgi:hypothetical protein
LQRGMTLALRYLSVSFAFKGIEVVRRSPDMSKPACTPVYMYVCVCMYVCIYKHIYIYIYIYIYI